MYQAHSSMSATNSSARGRAPSATKKLSNCGPRISIHKLGGLNRSWSRSPLTLPCSIAMERCYGVSALFSIPCSLSSPPSFKPLGLSLIIAPRERTNKSPWSLFLPL